MIRDRGEVQVGVDDLLPVWLVAVMVMVAAMAISTLICKILSYADSIVVSKNQVPAISPARLVETGRDCRVC